jgi:hypothetical protein
VDLGKGLRGIERGRGEVFIGHVLGGGGDSEIESPKIRDKVAARARSVAAWRGEEEEEHGPGVSAGEGR